MEIIIHDLPREKLKKIYKNTDNTLIITNNKKIKNCMGCFYCWTKNPGECRIKDGYDNLAELYSKAEKIIIISRCCYGSYSPFIKNILDRSIPYLLPFFKIKNKEMHHTIRYKKSFYFDVYFSHKKSRINYPAFSDVPEGIRTPDRRLRRPLLYPAELLRHYLIST